MPVLQQRSRCNNGPQCAVIYILALLAVHDISVSVTSRSGTATIVQAYARPPSYVSRYPAGKRCVCTDGKLLRGRYYKSVCELRCGGIVSDDLRGPTSRLMTKSGNGEVRNSAKYQLIWSPNFWKKMIMSMTVWIIIQYSLKNNAAVSLEKMLSPSCHSSEPITTSFNGFRRVFPSAVALPLLSSSCCAIQLIINAISGWGCAGFNTYLGPIRPVLLSLLLLSTLKLMPQRSIGGTITSLVLAFLPELVDIWNTMRSQQWQQKNGTVKNDMGSASALSSLPVRAKLRLDIPTMGCVSCVNKIDTSIRHCKSAANIREETSWLTDDSAKGGMAELLILGRTNEEIDGIVREVVDAVKNAGFQCKVESLLVGQK